MHDCIQIWKKGGGQIRPTICAVETAGTVESTAISAEAVLDEKAEIVAAFSSSTTTISADAYILMQICWSQKRQTIVALVVDK